MGSELFVNREADGYVGSNTLHVGDRISDLKAIKYKHMLMGWRIERPRGYQQCWSQTFVQTSDSFISTNGIECMRNASVVDNISLKD